MPPPESILNTANAVFFVLVSSFLSYNPNDEATRFS